jgi:uncharacterized protein (UPF0261 family)
LNHESCIDKEVLMPKSVVLVGALDTKGEEFRFVRDLIRTRGLETVVVDFGVMGDPAFAPDITADEVARAGGRTIAELRSGKDKALAMETMQRGLAEVVKDLYEQGRLSGVLGMAGSGGTSIATAAMRGLPIGVPKVMASTVAAGDVAAYVGTKDITMMPTVVDVSGINSISRRIYTNAAAAIAGMVEQEVPESAEGKPLVTASMFGNTTQCINHAQKILEGQGYEVLVFHATGTGGRTMESLIASGFITANLDLTTTELADQVCGGALSAGPDRLMAAASHGIPTVLAPGCVDMCNFWAIETVPEKYQARNLYRWNPNVTLMRTTPEENRQIGEWIARAANASTGPVAVLLPLKGVSQLDSPGGPYWDPEADGACYDAIRQNLKPGVPLVELDANINDPEFAGKAVELLRGMLK